MTELVSRVEALLALDSTTAVYGTLITQATYKLKQRFVRYVTAYHVTCSVGRSCTMLLTQFRWLLLSLSVQCRMTCAKTIKCCLLTVGEQERRNFELTLGDSTGLVAEQDVHRVRAGLQLC